MNNKKLILSAFLAANFLIAPAAYADGYPDTGPAAQAQMKKIVKKASIKKPVKKAAAKPKKQPVIKKAVLKPVKKNSLEMGKALMEQHRYEEARPWLQKAVQEQRRNAEAWYWYGMYHEKTGSFTQAQYFYTKAVQIDPLFDPLSRVMTYPNDTKTALWDKKRPGRVYAIPTETRNGTIIPPGAPQAARLPNRPDAQNNPIVPKVPVYTPPEPGATPNDGDAWQPSVYVPPTANNFSSGPQVYTPPSANGAVYNPPSNNLPQELEPKDNAAVYNPPLPVIHEQAQAEAAYQPPLPDNKAVQAASSTSSTSTKKTVKAAPKPAKKQAAAKGNSKRNSRRNSRTRQQTSSQTQAQSSQARPQAQQTPAQQPRPQARPAQQAQQRQQTRRETVRINELPPVGQTTNNGTFEIPLPPVGQN